MPGPTKLRLSQIRLPDNLDDQATSAQIANAVPSSITEEDFQRFFLSRLRQVMFGDQSGQHWYTDFLTPGVMSLAEVTNHELLDNEPVETGVKYTATRSGNLVTQEAWTNINNGQLVKTINYSFTGSLLMQELRRVYDALTGLTIVAQVTITYTYNGNVVASEVISRDI